jgi:hypothetical protein
MHHSHPLSKTISSVCETKTRETNKIFNPRVAATKCSYIQRSLFLVISKHNHLDLFSVPNYLRSQPPCVRVIITDIVSTKMFFVSSSAN